MGLSSNELPDGIELLPGDGRLLMESAKLKDPNGIIFNLWEEK